MKFSGVDAETGVGADADDEDGAVVLSTGGVDAGAVIIEVLIDDSAGDAAVVVESTGAVDPVTPCQIHLLSFLSNLACARSVFFTTLTVTPSRAGTPPFTASSANVPTVKEPCDATNACSATKACGSVTVFLFGTKTVAAGVVAVEVPGTEASMDAAGSVGSKICFLICVTGSSFGNGSIGN
jgi:hypothetical protein